MLLATLLAAIALVQCGGGAKGAGECTKSRSKNANSALAEPAAQAELPVAVAAVGNARAGEGGRWGSWGGQGGWRAGAGES